MATALAENTVASEIVRLLNSKNGKSFSASAAVDKYEDRTGVTLAREQREAVEMALSNKVSIITGGPGTGKTTIIGALYDIYKERYKTAKVLLCAPTGTAARKMSEATGIEAHTIHRSIGLMVSDDGKTEKTTTGNTLDVDFVIVDEFSMVDIYLASALFSAIPQDAQIVILGDVDQLPSVGSGAVLSDLINSGCIPLTRLLKIYRQKNGSKVAINAALIRDGRTDLVYDDNSFVFVPAGWPDEAAEKMRDIYLEETAVNGIDSVAMLSPFKKRTASCSNELNKTVNYVYNTICPIIKNLNHKPMIDSAIAVTRNQIRKGGQDTKKLNAIIEYLKS